MTEAGVVELVDLEHNLAVNLRQDFSVDTAQLFVMVSCHRPPYFPILRLLRVVLDYRVIHIRRIRIIVIPRSSEPF